MGEFRFGCRRPGGARAAELRQRGFHARQPQQVVRSAADRGLQPDPPTTDVARAGQPADRPTPADDLLHPFTRSLHRPICRRLHPASGATAGLGRGTASGVRKVSPAERTRRNGHVRRHTTPLQCVQEWAGLVAALAFLNFNGIELEAPGATSPI